MEEEQKILKRLKTAKESGNDEKLALQCSQMGEVRMNQGSYNEALRFFKKSLASCERLGDRVRRGVAHRMVGEAYTSLGEWEKALDHQTKYLELVETAGDQVEIQRAWASIGRLQMCLAESKGEEGEDLLRQHALAASRNALMKSLDIANNLNNLSKGHQVEMKARLILNLGLVQEYQGEGENALKKMQKAVELCEGNNLTEDLCRSLMSLAALKHRQGNHDIALVDLGRAIEVAKRLSGSDQITHTCDILSLQADIFFILGDFIAAKHALNKAYTMKAPNAGVQEAIQKSLKIAVTILQSKKQLLEMDEVDWLLRKKLYETIADCCTEVKAYNKAADYYKKMLECSETLGETGSALSTCLISVGASYKDDKQYHLALPYFERESELWDDNNKEMARSLLTIASVHKLKGDWLTQLAALEQALTQAVVSGSTKLQLEVLNEIAAHHRARNNTKAADEVENDILQLRADAPDTDTQGSSQDLAEVDTEVWANTNIDDLTTDASDDEQEIKTSRLRARSKCKVHRNLKGETGLHTACIGGKVDQVQRLLERGHPVNVRDYAGWTPLHEAANHGFVDIAELLLDKGANVNDKGGPTCDGYTPLHDAVSNGSFDTIELLINRGADVTAETFTKPRVTPLKIFMKWHKDNKSDLDEESEGNYQELCKRMRQAMEKAGVEESNEAEDSGGRSAALTYHRTGTSRSVDFSEPSTSRQQPNYENRAIVNLRKKNNLRISDTSSDDDGSHLRIGMLRRKRAVDRVISSDEEDRQEPSAHTKKRRSTPTVDLEKSSENTPCSSSRRLPTDGGPSASSEYAQVMQTIRGTNRHQGAEPFLNRVAKSALLLENEIEEEWLEDDMKAPNQTQPAKRMRTSTPTLPKQPPRSQRTSSSVAVERQPSPSPMNYEDSDADFEDAPPPSPPRRKVITPKKRTPQNSPRKSFHLSPYKPSQRAAEQVEQQVKVKVQVKDDKFLVPVPLRDLTIGWLADEVAQRYYRLKGVLPKLSLLTKDGALLSSTDAISLLVSSKDGEPDEVLAKVESFTLPPLTDRYKEACKAQDCGEDSHLLKCLEACQVTLTLQLSNLVLEAQSAPLLHALTRQQSLRELCLSGCALGDVGMEKVCTVLENLEQLDSLDLSCNNITMKGLTSIGNLVVDGKSLKVLSSLNLSHNPLESEGLALLAPIFEGLGTLKKLQLRDCNLTLHEDAATDGLPIFCLDSLTELDVSYNALGCQGLGHFFGRIDAWQLAKICVAHTNSPEQEEGYSVAKEVGLLLQKAMQGDAQGGIIALMDISGCSLADVDVYELLNALGDSGIRVEHLVLECNPALTPVCLRYLLQHQPPLPALTLTGCPTVLFPLQSDELPVGLTSLQLSALCSANAKALTLAWTLAKGPSARCRLGPGGLVKLSTQ